MIEVERRVVSTAGFAEGVGVVDFRRVRLVGSWRIRFCYFIGREERPQVCFSNHNVFEARRVAGRPETDISTFTGLELAVLAEVVPLKA